MVDPNGEVMRRKAVGPPDLGPAVMMTAQAAPCPPAALLPHAAIFARAAGEKISTSKVMQTGIILRHEAVGRNEA